MTSTNQIASDRSAVVIGGGFGGLASAIRLQAMGFQVTIFEKREKVGGRAYQFTEAGYTFDMGPSLITAPRIIESIFEAAGRRMDDYLSLEPLKPYYRVYFHDGSHIDYSGDAEQMKAQMREFNPADAERYDEFMEAIEPIYDAVITDRLGAQPFDTIRSMIEFLPKVVRLKAFLPVATYARSYFEDFRHQFLFSFQPLFIGGNPFRAPSIYIMLPYLEKQQGVWFTEGGMYSLVEALEALFLELGGSIRTSEEVSRIRVDQGQVTGVDTETGSMAADLVVSNADVAHTYRHLIDSGARRTWTDDRLERMDHTMSCFLLYLGVRKTYPQLEHHTLILTKRYRELVRDIFDRKILPYDFSMYLHSPTKSDPGMAPPGCESLYALIPVPNLEADIDWAETEPVFTERVLSFLEEWGLVGLRDHLDVCRTFTPRDFKETLNATSGNAFGLEPKPTQTAYFRPHNRSEDIDNLYFVGAGTHPGAGVPGVLLSAETTERCIREDLEDATLTAAPVG